MTHKIRPARFPDELDAVRSLFREYQAETGIDLCFQGFDAELADLPGCYAEPKGLLLCVESDARPVGCVALRPLAGGAAEMKRLFVKPAYQSKGVARELVVELIRRARGLGYARIYLDTVPGMERAQQLYSSLGFRDVGPYTHSPIAGARYMALAL